MVKNKEKYPYIYYKKNQVLFSENSDSKGVYFIKQGKIKISRTETEMKEKILYYATSGYFLGLSSLLNEHTHNSTATAIENSKVLFLSKKDFFNVIDQFPLINHQILISLNNLLDNIEDKFELSNNFDISKRIALSLYVLSKVTNNKQITISHNDFEKLTGISTCIMKEYLFEFQKKKIIGIKGKKIIILNRKDLQKLN